ncbi:hypothetical protein JCM8097_004201 [Rhodosporidiobolus ruineniae]
MPKSPAKGKDKPSDAPLRQFSISSFLPKGFSSSTTPTSTPTASINPPSSSKTKKRKVEPDEVVLSDDEDEDEFKKPALPVKKKGKVAAGKAKAKKAVPDVLDLTSDDDVAPSSSSPPRGSSKSMKAKGKAKGEVEETKESAGRKEGEINGLWVDEYAPRDRDDLALHPRKLLDVQTWLCEAYAIPLPEQPSVSSKKSSAVPKPPPPVNPKLVKYRRVLVLSGAAGSAKTAALKVLCEEMDVDIVEWAEGMRDEDGGYDGPRESLMNRFSSFLASAGMAPALDFVDFEDSSDAPPSSSSSSRASSSKLPLSPPSSKSRRLILLEDLPNVSHFPTKLALRSAIAQYLASPRVTCPLVVVISEALARPGADDGGGVSLGGGGRGDSFDARSVLGVELLQHPACREIAFNPIAPTIMRKALQRTLDRIYAPIASSSPSSSKSRSSRSKYASSSQPPTTVSGLDPSTRPSLTTLDLLIQHSNGDIRSALMSLQFLATQGGGDATSLGLGAKGDKGGKAKKRKRRRGSSDEESDEEDARGKMGGKDRVKQLLQFVTARESSLFIFHALGKVLYNKRWGDSADDDKKDLNRPGVLQELEYDKLPKHLRKAGWERKASKVDPDVLFAEAPLDPDIFLSYVHHNYPPFTNDIDECCGVLEGLSAGEAMMPAKGSGAGEGEEGYRRTAITSHYAFQLAVRQTLLSLPSPVPRRKQVLRKSELWETLRLSRQNEDGLSELLGLGATAGVGGLGGLAGLVYASSVPADGDAGVLVTRRESGSLLSEVVPWLGVIKPKHANSFLLDLAAFPPLEDAAQAVVTGAALGEKDLEEDGDEAAAPSSPTDNPSRSSRTRGRVLQEVDEAEDGEETVAAADGQGDVAAYFDTDDDIVD